MFKDDDVAAKIRKLLSAWTENSENDISTSSGSSMNSSLSSLHSRTPLSPLNIVMRTPENRLRVREKYNQELKEIDELEIWRAGKAVRSLRPENVK